MGWRIGVDIGGTFTDIAVLDEGSGRAGVAKVPTTPRDFGAAVIKGTRTAMDEYRIAPDSVTLISHATTIVTNALLESKGANVALVATRGFRDVLELRRSARADLYDLFQDGPSVLVPRRRRFEITERVDAQGKIVTPLDEAELDALVGSLRGLGGVEAVAVCLMFSFLNDTHEQRVGARLRAALPGLPVFLSSEILPEIREFERTSTTAVCAYVGPVLTSYLERLEAALGELDLPALHVMGSSGGVLDVAGALQMPAAAVESGPAAGVIAAQRLGAQIGRANLISFDMGGTTAKASLIENGRIETTSEYEVGGQGNVGRWLHGTGHPIRVPVIDLAEVSAGGGSIAWLDPGGALRVGPGSAGAEPGPACYARGGDRPTVTDANVVLGLLSRTHLLGGRLPIDAAAAEAAVRAHVADPLGQGVMEAAAGIVSVVNHGMAEALRIVSVERGHDAREFSLVAFGGAGPVHAAALAEELDIPEVVVPPIPGGFSALGLVATDLRAQIAANRRACERLATLAGKYGTANLKRIMQEVMDYSETMMRALLREIPDGEGTFEDFCDGDGIFAHGANQDETFDIRLRVVKRGDTLTVDFAGSDPQVPGPMNAPLSVTSSGVFTALKMAIDSAGVVPPNSGARRPVEVLAPEGTVVNAQFPAPVVYANHEISHRVCDMVFGALASIIPDRVMACSQGTSAVLTLGGVDYRTGEHYVSYETVKGGFGARPDRDGISAIASGISNTMNTPVEVIEMSFPVRVETYELLPDSGGAGRFRGGLGARRTWRILERDSRATVCCERTKSPPFGIAGGAAGTPARISVVEPDGAERILNSKGSFDAPAGSLVVFDVPGSGGYGPPAERDPARLREDLADGYVTPDGARRDYGVPDPDAPLASGNRSGSGEPR